MVMKENKNLTALSKVFLESYFEGVPEDLWPIFYPQSEEDLDQFIMNLISYTSREAERNKVMNLQRYYGLRISPNESMSHLIVRIRMMELKKKLQKKQS